ncbi:MAG: FecR domain-containing protein [Sedimentisphaerales bacterium]
MMTCEKYKNLIEKHIEGTISEGQLAELKAHTETCESCREQFERCVLLQDVVKHAFSSRTSAEQAGAALVARLSEEPNLRLRPARFGTALFAGKRAAIAAGILLAIGLFLGFALGRAAKSARIPLTAQVPISIGKIEGTVLVRHEGSDVWQILESGSNVHLGDTFHSAAQSACILEFEDKSTIDLSQNSMLVLKLYNGETQFFLEHGECTASLESPHGRFFISTPHGRVEALGTEFTVTVTDE